MSGSYGRSKTSREEKPMGLNNNEKIIGN